MFKALIVIIVSRPYTYLQTQVACLRMYSFLYINYSSTKWFFKLKKILQAPPPQKNQRLHSRGKGRLFFTCGKRMELENLSRER